MYTIGKFLKKHREATGLTAEDVAKKLYLRIDIVKAIEKENFKVFKSPAILRGLVKNYATLIGADVNTALAILRRQLGENAPKLEKVDTPIKSSSFQITPLHVLLVVLGFVTVILLGYLISSYVKTLKYPTLVVESPKEKTVVVNTDKYEIKGIVEQDSILTINGHNISYDKGGHFSYMAELQEGENIVEIVVHRKYDNTKKVIRKFLIVYKNNEEADSSRPNDNVQEVKPMKFRVQIKSNDAWIQIVVDKVQKAIGIKPAGYNKTFMVKKEVYIITGRPAITYVYANGKRINWVTDSNSFKISCKLENTSWICNNTNIER